MKYLAKVCLSFIICLCIPACAGLQPLYGKKNKIDAHIGNISVLGQHINKLDYAMRRSFLNNAAFTPSSANTLDITIKTSKDGIAISSDGSYTRSKISIHISFQVIDKHGNMLLSGSKNASTNIAITSSPYSNLVAEEEGTCQLADILAKQIILEMLYKKLSIADTAE